MATDWGKQPYSPDIKIDQFLAGFSGCIAGCSLLKKGSCSSVGYDLSPNQPAEPETKLCPLVDWEDHPIPRDGKQTLGTYARVTLS